MFRNPLLFGARCGMYSVSVFLCWATYYRLGNDFNSIQDRQGCVAFMSIMLMFNAVTATLIPFMYYKPVFEREFSTGLYGSMSVYMSNSLIYLPLDIMFGFVEWCIIYWTVGMNPLIDNFFKALWIMLLMGATGNSLGVFIAVVSPSIEFAIEFATAFVLPMIAWGGIFLNIEDIPEWLPWKWLSPIRFSFEAMIRNEYDNLNSMSSDLSDAAVDHLNL